MKKWTSALLGILKVGFVIVPIGIAELFLTQWHWGRYLLTVALGIVIGLLVSHWLDTKSWYVSMVGRRSRLFFSTLVLTILVSGALSLWVAHRDSVVLNHRVVLNSSDEVLSPMPESSPQRRNLGYPEFPWPPHKFTTHLLVPMRLVVVGRTQTLGAMFDRLVFALKDAQISDWSAYAIGFNGFAVVARLECIDEAGRARPGAERWCADYENSSHFSRLSFSRYIELLFSAAPGRYRVIVFTVTPRLLRSNGGAPNEGTMRELLSSGALDNIPEELRKEIPGPDTRCTALICAASPGT